jgi:predicted ATPase
VDPSTVSSAVSRRPHWGKLYREIRLNDLSPSESLQMVRSLLHTETIPHDLQRFFQDRVQGNPFYLEEVVNGLVDSGALVRDGDAWKLTKEMDVPEVSSTIYGVIGARLDRLEKEAKHVLQEASVIGRSFLFEILKRTTTLIEHCERAVSGLERLDFIRVRTMDPELEYIFKHALTQEVVYNGLLKKERREIHARVARVIEEVFATRLPEFYEILAYHYSHGESPAKAVEYLMKSGEKSLARYAVNEADQYYEQAYRIVSALKMVEGQGPKSLSLLARNIPFLITNIPFADKKAQEHLEEVVGVSESIGKSFGN